MNPFSTCDVFREAIQEGKQALGSHRTKVVESRQIKCSSSLNFEAAVGNRRPALKRWDYFIECSSRPGQAHAVEVHRYSESDLVSKMTGTKELIEHCCPGGSAVLTSWNVILEGASPRADLAARFQARTGIKIVGRALKIEQLT